MFRNTIIAAGALALISSAALAETATVTTGDVGSRTVITRSSPEMMGGKRVIVKRHVNRFGNLVTKKKIIREGLTGSSVTHVRKSTDPMTGVTTRERREELR